MNELQLELPLFEEWKTIDGYEDYQVSNFGRVKSLGNNKKRKEKILKPINNKGYQRVHLCKDGKRKLFRVHRLVAMAFIPNPNNYTEVNHIDECKTNNHVDNLEWCTDEYNSNYGTRNERLSKALRGENSPMFGKFGKDCPNSKQVIQLTLDGEVVRKWDCITDVKRELGINHSHIGSCCSGKRKTSNGYKWCYA